MAACLPFAVFVVRYIDVFIALVTNGAAIIFSSTFGRAHLGTLDSLGNAFSTLSLGVGPLTFGLAKELTGSYRPMFIVLVALAALASVSLATLQPLPPPSRSIKLVDGQAVE